MIRNLATTAAALSILLAVHRDCLAQERVVSLSVQPEIHTNKRVIVGGKTNLPPHTSLVISLEDAVTGESRGQTKTRVLSDGTYKSELLGPLSGLKDGQYVASVTMPIARVQPEAVRQVIGDNGQNLKGPLVEKDILGITVIAEKKFSVGGEDAAGTQTTRLKSELAQYRDLTKQIKERFSRLEKTKRTGLLDDQNSLTNLRAWGMFARQFRSDLKNLQKRVDKVASLQARLYLAGALGDVGSMFHDATFKKENEYRESKSAYADSLEELEAFIRERESTMPKRNGDSRAKRAANEFRKSTDVTYTIVDCHVVPGIKRSLDIRLNKKVSEETLRALALKLKSQDSRNYERTFIGYYLPDMKVGAGAWATTHFNPDLEVRILGLTAEQEEALKQQPDDPSREVIGSWIDDRMHVGNRITIFRQDGKLFMGNTYKDGSSGKKEIVAKPSTSGKKFEDKRGNSFGEFYLIDSRGNLQLWDQDGLISTARKIGG